MKLPTCTLAPAAVLMLLSLNAFAQTPSNHPGPSLPPELRSPAPYTPASGAALRAQAMQKLQRRFEEADLDRSGSVTREEARRAGLGFVENSFDQIDARGRGRVSFDDVRGFMAERDKAAKGVQER
jgi:hypothetical protein